MTREEARAKYLELRSAGFNDEEAKDAIRSGQHEDPTASYWDALIQQESGGRQSAVSPKGATGIAQVMPGTGPEAAQLAGREWNEDAWRNDPEYNSAIGRAYLRAQMRRFGDPELGLAAYNAGPGRVQQMLDQGRQLPPETRNYVPAITGNSQEQGNMAMTRDQARQYAQQRLAEGADMATIKAEIQQQMGQMPAQAQTTQMPQQEMAPASAPVAPPTPEVPPMLAPQPGAQPPAAPALASLQSMAQPAPQPAAPVPAPQPELPPTEAGSRPQDIDQIAQSLLREAWPAMSGDPGSRGIHAFGRGLADLLRGGRQLWNQLGYTEEDKRDLEYLKNQELEARKFEQEINPKGSGLNLQDIAKLTPSMMAFGGMGPSAGAGVAGTLGGGAAAGAIQGAAAPVAPNESRLDNTLIGGGVGLAAGGLTGGVKLTNFLRDRAKNTIGTREALGDFTERALGAKRGGNIIPTYKSIGNKVTSQVDDLQKQFSKLYKEVELDEALPPVTLLRSARAGDEFSLSDDVARVLSPRGRRVLQQLDQSSTVTSPIVGPKGEAIQYPQKTTFRDVRETIREIRAATRKLNPGDTAALQLRRAEEMLNDDLLAWGAKNSKTEAALSAARQVDSRYADEVVPFFSKDTKVGKYFTSGEMDEQAFNRSFMSDEAGMAVEDLQRRVPGATGDLRKLYGSKLREARGDVPTIRKLESGTTGEALLSTPEREYLQKLAQEIYREGGPAQHSSVMPTGLMRLLEKTTFSEDLQRMMGGLRPYGQQAPTQNIRPGTDQLIRYLRATGVNQATED